jgi:hypothetical protein
VIALMLVDFNLIVRIAAALATMIGVLVYMHKKGYFSNRMRLA